MVKDASLSQSVKNAITFLSLELIVDVETDVSASSVVDFTK